MRISEPAVQAKHTATPWKIGPYGEVFQDGDKFKDRILLTGFALNSGHPSQVAEANTAFIVRACNAHQELVEALRGVIRVADRDTDEFNAARAALAKATATE